MGKGGGRCIAAGLAGALAFCPASRAAAASLSVLITGRDGKPVHDAVVVAAPASFSAAPPAATPPQVVVDQRGREFRPWVSVIRAGTPVLFANHDDITHHVYSFSAPKRFSFRLKAGETRGPLDFDRPGVVVLGCNIHDWMIAYIYVTRSPYFARSDHAGLARISGLAPGSWQVTLWHPGLRNTGRYRQTVRLGDASDATLRIRLREPLSVTGPQPPDDTAYP